MFLFFFILFVVIAIMAALSEIFRPLSAKERNQRAGRQSSYSRKRSEQRIRNRMYYIQNNSGNHSSSSHRSRHNDTQLCDMDTFIDNLTPEDLGYGDYQQCDCCDYDYDSNNSGWQDCDNSSSYCNDCCDSYDDYSDNNGDEE